jgi:hypothetical protein
MVEASQFRAAFGIEEGLGGQIIRTLLLSTSIVLWAALNPLSAADTYRTVLPLLAALAALFRLREALRIRLHRH